MTPWTRWLDKRRPATKRPVHWEDSIKNDPFTKTEGRSSAGRLTGSQELKTQGPRAQEITRQGEMGAEGRF